MPTEPTLYYACMSAGGRFEYDSAAFASKNPGPNYKDHETLHQQMSAAFDAYLTQKYGFHGIVTCGNYKTLAEAQQWLQGRVSRSQSPGMQYQYVATDWTYDAGAAATATKPDATPPSVQPAVAAANEPKAFYVCTALSQGVLYESAVFEASNNAGVARRIFLSFGMFLNQKYHVSAPASCAPRPTRDGAQAYLQQHSAAMSGVSQHVATGWIYDSTPSQPAQPTTDAAPVTSVAPASSPVASPPVAPKPVVPQPAAAAAIKPAAPAAAAAPKGAFVVCYADSDPQTLYYNPPIDGGNGDYGTWMPSYKSFMQEKYRYTQTVRCNQQPTLDQAQAYYQTMLDQARVRMSSNGVPSPVVITNWKFQ